MQPVSVFWFRRDLRLYDNHGFYQALNSGHPVLAIFIFDKYILDHLPHEDRRVVFIHQALSKLKVDLEAAESSLLVLHDTPEGAFEKICKEYTVHAVFTNHDYEPYAKERDERIRVLLQQKSIAFYTYKDQVLFEKDEVVKSDGSPYNVYSPYSRVWKQKMLQEGVPDYPSEERFAQLYHTQPFHLPTLEAIGFANMQINVPPAEFAADVVAHYAETRNLPAVNGTSKLSVHLRFGTVSIRRLVKLAAETNEQWLNELIWREFFMMILYHYPHVVNESFKKRYDRIRWRNNEQDFECWCRGETGYPLVDAGMRELNATGFMHNRVRMVAASFLTKHLLIDWRWGEAYFAEKLMDYELASNNGNWQWAAGSGCDAAPYFRIFNPIEQQRKFDPKLEYVNKWVDLSHGYIPPIVDHAFARNRALEVFKAAVGNASE